MKKIKLSGWKGKSGIQVVSEQDDYLIIEYRKNKESGEVTENRTVIEKDKVDTIYTLLKEQCTKGIVYGYRYIARLLIEHYRLDIDLNAWNGGKNRTKYYFPLHYYPLKILEYQSKIKYFGRGGVQLE